MKTNTWTLFATLVALLCSSACSMEPVETVGPPTYDLPAEPTALPAIHVCIDVAPDQFERVRAGVEGWRWSTEAWRAWEYVENDDPACDLHIHEELKGACSTWSDSGCATDGGLQYDEPAVTEVRLIRGNYEFNPELVVLHEIGHTLGLPHVDGTVMEATWPAAMMKAKWVCPDAETIGSLAERLGVDGLRACVQ